LYLQPLVHAVRTIARRSQPAEIRELAGSRLGTLAQLVPELTDMVGAVPYERAGPELEHGRGLDALAGFFVRLSARRPVLLTVDDVHHAGQSTLEALHFLAGQWAGSRLMVVVTERTSEDEPLAGALRGVARSWLELGPLTMPDVATLVARSGLDYDVARLYSWTGGSPLFVTELLRHPAPSSAPAAGGPMIVPGSLHEAVEERIAHAGEQTAELLAQGAVLGAGFSLDDVAALSGLGVEDCARRAGRALRAGLLVARGDASGSPTTSSARWPTSRPRNRSGSAGTAAPPGCWRSAPRPPPGTTRPPATGPPPPARGWPPGTPPTWPSPTPRPPSCSARRWTRRARRATSGC